MSQVPALLTVFALFAAIAMPQTAPAPRGLFDNSWAKATDYPTGPTHIDHHGILIDLGRTPPTAVWVNPGAASPSTRHIFVELKRAAPPPPPALDPMDSVRTAGATQTVIFENEYVRVINDTIPVNAVEPMHHHPHGIVVYLSPNYVTQQILPDGTTRSNTHQQYDVTWGEQLTHSVKNISPVTSHAIRIELKY